jgi:hypothetical protein
LADLDQVARSGRAERRPAFQFNLRRLERVQNEVKAANE